MGFNKPFAGPGTHPLNFLYGLIWSYMEALMKFSVARARCLMRDNFYFVRFKFCLFGISSTFMYIWKFNCILIHFIHFSLFFYLITCLVIQYIFKISLLYNFPCHVVIWLCCGVMGRDPLWWRGSVVKNVLGTRSPQVTWFCNEVFWREN